MYLRLDRIETNPKNYKLSAGRDKQGYWVKTSKEYKKLLKKLKLDFRREECEQWQK